MTLTIEQVMADAKKLVDRLKEHDSAADTLIAQSETLNKRVDAMKQYQDDLAEMNDAARHRPRSALVLGIQQENRQIRELQQENKELRTALEEHQSALELIMSKYREQVLKLMLANNWDKASLNVHQENSKELQHMTEKICEMAAVMTYAMNMDDESVAMETELLTRLQVENKGLREVLGISRRFNHKTNIINQTSSDNLVTKSGSIEKEIVNDSQVDIEEKGRESESTEDDSEHSQDEGVDVVMKIKDVKRNDEGKDKDEKEDITKEKDEMKVVCSNAGEIKEDYSNDEKTEEKPFKDKETKESSKDGETKEESSKDGETKEKSSEDGETKEESSKDGETKEKSSKDGETKEKFSKDGETKEESSKDGETKEESSKDGEMEEDADNKNEKETEEQCHKKDNKIEMSDSLDKNDKKDEESDDTDTPKC
ncbi:uncharacterized protein LOC100366677 [Saccoglossus kowalevskii]|uniref:Myb-like protein X-like n=1 Tax=Saccoglossus kowalevskii TaxID=10224 RepID=A0ABM0MP02_SACKO|nr:PREDICTED: myb-like protein X-like [Saccoglossus kowalevskii]